MTLTKNGKPIGKDDIPTKSLHLHSPKQIDVTPKQKENFIYTKCLDLKNKAITAKNVIDRE